MSYEDTSSGQGTAKVSFKLTETKSRQKPNPAVPPKEAEEEHKKIKRDPKKATHLGVRG